MEEKINNRASGGSRERKGETEKVAGVVDPFRVLVEIRDVITYTVSRNRHILF